MTAVSAADARGIPSVGASRALTKWRKAEDGAVEGIEIVKSDGPMGDPLGGGSGFGGATSAGPAFASKSRIRMER